MSDGAPSRLRILTRGQVVLLAALVIVGGAVVWFAVQEAVEQFYAEQQQVFRRDAQKFDATFRNHVTSILDVFANTDSFFVASKDVTPDELRRFVNTSRTQYQFQDVRSLYYLPPSSFQLSQTTGTSTHSVSQVQEYQVLYQQEQGDGLVADVLESDEFRHSVRVAANKDSVQALIPEGGQNHIYFVRPIHDSGRLEGYIGSSISLAAFREQNYVGQHFDYTIRARVLVDEESPEQVVSTSREKRGPSDTNNLLAVFGIDRWEEQTDFKLAGVDWTIEYTALPTAGGSFIVRIAPFVFLGVGIILIVALAGVVFLALTNQQRAQQKAKQMTSRLRRRNRILEISPDFIGSADLRGNVLYLNKAARQMLGISKEDVDECSVEDNHPAWALQKMQKEGFPTAQKEGMWRGETAILGPNGGEIPVDMILMAHYDDSGNTTYFSTIARDITKQKQTQQELELRNRAMEQSTDGVLITDPHQEDNPIVYANQAFYNLTGYSPDEVLGFNCRFLQGDDRDQQAIGRLREAIDNEESVDVTLRNYTKDGELFYNQLTVSPVYDDDGNLLNFVGVQHDITDTKQTQMELEEKLETIQQLREKAQEEEAKDEAILRSLGEGLMVTDEEGYLTFVNEAFSDLLWLGDSEVAGQKVSNVIRVANESDEAISFEHDVLLPVLSQEEERSVTDTYFFTSDHRETFPVKLTVSPIRHEGDVIGGVAVFRDITHERAVDKAKTEFVSLASHQLRTPLSTINWYTEMLLDGDAGELTDSQREFLQQVYESDQRMIALVNALLNVSRIELGTLAIQPEPTDIRELAKSVIQEVKQRIEEKNLDFRNDFADDLPEITVDPSLMRIVIQNLLTNAIKYTPAGNAFGINIHRVEAGQHIEGVDIEEDSALIVVWDHGYGIPPEAQDKVFTKMFRADNIKQRDATGTGLGLYIAKAVIESGGGRIWFSSTEGKGTTFFATVPLSGMQKKEGSKGLIISDY